MATLTVRNVAQKVLFDEEIAGQLSDGHWENASPRDHWEKWCEADVVVADETRKVGRDFTPRRKGYLLTDPRLLDVVGNRMLAAVRVGVTYGPEYAHLAEWTLYRETLADLPSYADKKTRESFQTVSFESMRVTAHDESIYDMAAMKRDLRDLQKIMAGTAS